MKHFVIDAIIGAVFLGAATGSFVHETWYDGIDTCVNVDSEKSLCWRPGDYTPYKTIYTNGTVEYR